MSFLSIGDYETFIQTVNMSSSRFLVVEGDADRDNILRYVNHQNIDHTVVVIASSQIESVPVAVSGARGRVEYVSMEEASVTGVADTDACIDSLLGYTDRRLNLDNLFYSDGCSLENYILIEWSHLQTLFDPSGTRWPLTDDYLDRYVFSMAIWSVLIRTLTIRRAATRPTGENLSKSSLVGIVCALSPDDIIRVGSELVANSSILEYTGLSSDEIEIAQEEVRNEVGQLSTVQKLLMIDKRLVGITVKLVLASAEIERFKELSIDNLVDACLGHLYCSSNIDWHGARALTYSSSTKN